MFWVFVKERDCVQVKGWGPVERFMMEVMERDRWAVRLK